LAGGATTAALPVTAAGHTPGTGALAVTTTTAETSGAAKRSASAMSPQRSILKNSSPGAFRTGGAGSNFAKVYPDNTI
jgi:hypothetical protein